jgi:hypothetical protein
MRHWDRSLIVWESIVCSRIESFSWTMGSEWMAVGILSSWRGKEGSIVRAEFAARCGLFELEIHGNIHLQNNLTTVWCTSCHYGGYVGQWDAVCISGSTSLVACHLSSLIFSSWIVENFAPIFHPLCHIHSKWLCCYLFLLLRLAWLLIAYMRKGQGKECGARKVPWMEIEGGGFFRN